VRLLGERDDVDDLLAAADAVVNTSRWEGLSLALLEALWRGRPLVVVDAPGNAEAAGDAGLVVRERDAAAVAAAIERLFAEPRLLEALSGRARARAEACFDERRMVAGTLALYDELVP
jgi:glycosyltransferase involved in cell wall biosynthesis